MNKIASYFDIALDIHIDIDIDVYIQCSSLVFDSYPNCIGSENIGRFEEAPAHPPSTNR